MRRLKKTSSVGSAITKLKNACRKTSEPNCPKYVRSFFLRQPSVCGVTFSARFLRLKMPRSSEDPRRRFLLATARNFYSLRAEASLSDSPQLSNFLDDANEVLLSVTTNDNGLLFSNKVNKGLNVEEAVRAGGCIDINQYVIICFGNFVEIKESHKTHSFIFNFTVNQLSYCTLFQCIYLKSALLLKGNTI